MTILNRTAVSLLVCFIALASDDACAQEPMRLSLHDAAALAAEQNPLVRAAHQDVQASEKQLSRAWREYVPTISANARYSYLNDAIGLQVEPITLPIPPRGLTLTLDPIHLLDRSTVRADISATVPIFTGLRIESGIRAARHLVQDATAQDTLALQKNVSEALLAYHQCLFASEVEIARGEALATVRKHAHDVQLLCGQGIATRYDVIRANLAVAEAERGLEEAANQKGLAFRTIKKTLALPEEAVLLLSDSLNYQTRTVQLEAALVEAEESRPELLSIREKQEALQALSMTEAGKLLPQIGAFARYELVDRGLTQLDPKWVVGVGASLTIFNGLKDLASAQVYDIQGRKLEELRLEASNAVALEVRKYYYDMKSAERNIASTRTAIDLSVEALRMANRRFETGMGTSLEVIDAQTSVVVSRTAHAGALFAYRTSYVQLVRALGRTTELLTGVFSSL